MLPHQQGSAPRESPLRRAAGLGTPTEPLLRQAAARGPYPPGQRRRRSGHSKAAPHSSCYSSLRAAAQSPLSPPQHLRQWSHGSRAWDSSTAFAPGTGISATSCLTPTALCYFASYFSNFHLMRFRRIPTPLSPTNCSANSPEGSGTPHKHQPSGEHQVLRGKAEGSAAPTHPGEPP